MALKLALLNLVTTVIDRASPQVIEDAVDGIVAAIEAGRAPTPAPEPAPEPTP